MKVGMLLRSIFLVTTTVNPQSVLFKVVWNTETFISHLTDSPSKKSRLETGGAAGGSGDNNETEMDVQESVEDLEENKDEDQEMDIIQDSSHLTHQPKVERGQG